MQQQKQKLLVHLLVQKHIPMNKLRRQKQLLAVKLMVTSQLHLLVQKAMQMKKSQLNLNHMQRRLM